MPEKINKMPEFYMIFVRKIFLPIFWGEGASAPLPPSPTPMYTGFFYRHCSVGLRVAGRCVDAVDLLRRLLGRFYFRQLAKSSSGPASAAAALGGQLRLRRRPPCLRHSP